MGGFHSHPMCPLLCKSHYNSPLKREGDRGVLKVEPGLVQLNLNRLSQPIIAVCYLKA